MKEFFRSYMELQKHSNAWMKKHWKGYILLTLGLSALIYGPVFYIKWKNEQEWKAITAEHETSIQEEES